MYAIIAAGGKQYKVSEGDTVKIEKLEVKDGDAVSFDVLMVADGEKVTAGTPTVKGAKVSAKVLHAEGKGEKITVFKYKAKKNVRKKQGHRQPYTEVKIEKISV